MTGRQCTAECERNGPPPLLIRPEAGLRCISRRQTGMSGNNPRDPHSRCSGRASAPSYAVNHKQCGQTAVRRDRPPSCGGCRAGAASAVRPGGARPTTRREEGGGGGGCSETQKFVYQKWPNRFSRLYILFFPTMVTLVGGGGVLLRLLAVRMLLWAVQRSGLCRMEVWVAGAGQAGGWGEGGLKAQAKRRCRWSLWWTAPVQHRHQPRATGEQPLKAT